MDGFTDLRHFFNPRSVALVGATDDLTKFGGRCLQLLGRFGFAGRIYPVNPRRTEIGGLTCYQSVAALPEAPDHVGVVVPSASVLPVLEACAERGVKFATVFTAGFLETGTAEGRAMQADIAALARRTGLRIMGPNCNGLINFVDGFALTSTAAVAGARAAAGNVGVVAHSGGLGQVNVMWRAQQAGVPISYEVSCGNDADLDALDFAHFMVEDPATEVVLLLAERISSGRKLAALATRAAELQKPIVVLKLGRTEAGSRAAASHTGAVTGANTVHDAAFREYGLIRVDDCNELYETAMLLRRRTLRPAGRRLGGMAVSGGNAVLLTDHGALAGLEWPDYAETTQQALAEYLPGFGHVTNPTDLTAAAIGQQDVFGKVLDIITADANVDVMVPILTFASRREIERVIEAGQTAPKTVAVLWSGGCNDDPSVGPSRFAAAEVPMFRDTMPLLKAVRRAADYTAFLQARAGRQAPVRPPGVDRARAQALLQAGSMTERDSKAVLAAYGLPVTQEGLARSAEEAVALAADRVVAMKIESPDIAHKSESGGVRLGVTGAGAVAASFQEIMEAARSYAPNARLNGVLIQEMAPPGTEVMLGMQRDPVFGPVIAVALGGIFVEILADVAHRLAPVTQADALEMLRELKGFAVLKGARGRQAADIPALCAAIVRLSWLSHDLGDALLELDVNPVIVGPAGAGLRVVDALIVGAA